MLRKVFCFAQKATVVVSIIAACSYTNALFLQGSASLKLPEPESTSAPKTVSLIEMRDLAMWNMAGQDPEVYVAVQNTVNAPTVTSIDMPIEMEVPNVDSSFKSYMDFRRITNKESEQWALQTVATTDHHGLRTLDGKYLVAMGTYYTDHVGAEFRITLISGKSFEVIVGDIKDDKDTDTKHQHKNGNVVEFIVETELLSRDVRLMGDVSYTPDAGLKGSVSKIEYLGEYEQRGDAF